MPAEPLPPIADRELVGGGTDAAGSTAGSAAVGTSRLPLSEADCYRAVRSRDARFDGWFFIAVTTTGIYCRPACPTPVHPKPEHSRFFATAAGAQAAGYRACKRCRPDTSPGSPEWDLRADLVGRAMRLIADGVVDREGVPGLARRLAVSTRHLDRVLSAELGAGPLAIARAQRAHTARVLVETTDLRLADVAFAAGFSSIRQFNDTMRVVYDRSPSEMRTRAPGRRRSSGSSSSSLDAVGRHGRRSEDVAVTGPSDGSSGDAVARAAGLSDGAAAGSRGASSGIGSGDALRRSDDAIAAGGRETPSGALTVRLAHRSPLDVDGLLGWFRARPIAGSRWVDGSTLHVGLRLAGGVAHAALTPVPGESHVRAEFALADLADLTAAVERCRRLLDLDADPIAVADDLGCDPRLRAALSGCPGIRVPGSVDGLETAVVAIVGQQVSVNAAHAIVSRIVERHGASSSSDGSRWMERRSGTDASQQMVSGRVAGGSPRVGATAAGTSPSTKSGPLWTGGVLAFPAADVLAEADLEGCGATRRGAGAIRSVATLVADGLELAPGADRAEVRSRLLEVRGVGPWTADYVALRALRDPDVLPVGDLVVRRGAAALGLPDDAGELARAASAWSPWRSYVAHLCWTTTTRPTGPTRPARSRRRSPAAGPARSADPATSAARSSLEDGSSRAVRASSTSAADPSVEAGSSRAVRGSATSAAHPDQESAVTVLPEPADPLAPLRTRSVESPVGVLTLVASPTGVRAVLWPDDESGGRVRFAVEPGPHDDPDDAHPVLDAAEAQLAEWFAGERTTFALPLEAAGTAFQRAVWMSLTTIPFGETSTYGVQAAALGRPTAVRAVASANGRNPLSIVVPCHRIIGRDGSLTGFAGGLDAKAWLLDHERQVLARTAPA